MGAVITIYFNISIRISKIVLELNSNNFEMENRFWPKMLPISCHETTNHLYIIIDNAFYFKIYTK